MHDTTRGGLSWARVAIEKTPALFGLIGLFLNFLEVMGTSCLERTRGALQ